MLTYSRPSPEAGFTLIDIMITVAVFAIFMAAAIPQIQDLTAGMRLGQAVREVERELQSARLKAVSTNRPIRVRFNCPVAGEFRTVELMGTPSAPQVNDTAANRCQESSYPYPAADRDPLTRPNHDGPLRRIDRRVAFGVAPTLEFWPDGTVHQQAASENPWSVVPPGGTAVTLTLGTTVRIITVNGLGRIQLQ
jgi:Tfp pilus assembly protein FimT